MLSSIIPRYLHPKQQYPLLFIAFLSIVSCHTFADIVIGMVGKTKNDSFYLQSLKGCLTFAESHKNMRCIYDGANNYQDIRSQNIIVNDLLKKGIDGLLISITDSEFLAKDSLQTLKENNIPVITFDSDLLPEHQKFRLAYVGTDNFNFGKALGTYIKKFAKQDDNYLCLQSGHSSAPNLNERIAGVRYALSEQSTERLSGKNGWFESARCPLYSLGKRASALNQLLFIIDREKPPIFLAVAGFAQFSTDYITRMQPFKERITNGEIVIVSADTEQTQIAALQAGVSVANLGQMPFEMGRLSAELLYKFITANEKPDKSHYYLDYHYCTQDNATSCTVNY